MEGIPPLTFSFLPISTLDKYSVPEVKKAGETYKLNILRQIKGHNWGFVITPNSKKQLGISFRSTPGGPNVRLLANKLGGGGHDLAAAGKIIVDGVQIKESPDGVAFILNLIKDEGVTLT